MNILLSTIVSILTFGAVADNGQVNNAPAINKAIEYCSLHGGGRVVIPAGTYVTGTIFLKNYVTLVLSKGAVLKGSSRLIDYLPLVTTLDLSKYESGEGTVNFLAVSPRKVLELAIKKKAAAVIIAHNHPRGIAKPSCEDIEATRIIANLFETTGRRILAHYVFAGDLHEVIIPT